MARDHARILIDIWSDEDFRALSRDAQHAYFLALSQPGLSYCGVVPFTLRRWSGLAHDATIPKLRRSIAALEVARYVLVDEDSEELLIRSFIRNDGILGSPNVCRAAVKAFPAIQSARLRTAFLVELHRLNEQPQEDGWEKGWAVLSVLLSEPFPNPPEGLPTGFRESRVRAAPAPLPNQSLTPAICPHDSDPSLCAFCTRAAKRARAS